MVLSDKEINKLFEGKPYGADVLADVQSKRERIAKTLQNQIDGFWSGHTSYNLVVEAGLLRDAKSGERKSLTPLGEKFMREHAASQRY